MGRVRARNSHHERAILEKKEDSPRRLLKRDNFDPFKLLHFHPTSDHVLLGSTCSCSDQPTTAFTVSGAAERSFKVAEHQGDEGRVKTAVSTGGYDLKLNRKLADLQLEFKSLGLSLDTFNNYLVKLKNKPDLTFHYDLIGPSGSFFIIEAEGENKSKIQSQIAKSIKKIGGFRFAADSLQNRFEAKGIVHISAKTADGKTLKVEDVEELAIELDCEEVTALNDDGEKLEFTTEPNNVSKLESELAAKGYTIELAETQLIPLHAITVSEAESTLVEKFYEALQDVEEVKQIFDNIDSSEGTAAAATA